MQSLRSTNSRFFLSPRSAQGLSFRSALSRSSSANDIHLDEDAIKEFQETMQKNKELLEQIDDREEQLRTVKERNVNLQNALKEKEDDISKQKELTERKTKQIKRHVYHKSYFKETICLIEREYG